MLYILESNKRRAALVVSVALTSVLMAQGSFASLNDQLSFTPGPEPTSSACDGAYKYSGWAQNVNADVDKADLLFQITNVTNSDIFLKQPRVSWNSKTLTYELKPGIPGNLVSTVTAVLIDKSASEVEGKEGRAPSYPQSWNIYTSGCQSESDIGPDEDNDGLSDIDEGGGVLDTDGDGMPDSQDTDSDNDGIADIDESGDTDNDGIRDSEEANGYDVSTDSDGDGISDEYDIDDDNDGIIDVIEGSGEVDTDNDNLPDSRDLDSDNDGVSDLIESGADLTVIAFSKAGSIISEIGMNGLADLLETSPDSGIPLSLPHDTDNDGTANFQEGIPGLLGNDPAQDLFSDESAFTGGITTGLQGGGCALGGRAAFDPLLILTAMFAFMYLSRRRILILLGQRD